MIYYFTIIILLFSMTNECDFLDSCMVYNEFDFYFKQVYDIIKNKIIEIKKFINASDLYEIIDFIKEKGNEILINLCVDKIYSRKLCEYFINWIFTRLKNFIN